MKLKDHPVKLSRVIVICLIVSILTGAIVYATSPTQPFTINRGVYPGGPSFTVWEEDGTYFAKNAYGVISYSGADAATVIKLACDNGNSVFLASGLYPISTSIELNASNTGLYLYGEGQTSILQVADDGVIPLFVNGALNITISNVAIDGNKDSYTTGAAGLYIGANMYSIFSDIWIRDCSVDGLYFQYSQRSMFNNIFIDGSGAYGFHAYNSAGETNIANLFVYLSGDSGIFLDSVDYWTLTNIQSVGSGEHGIILDHTGDYANSFNTLQNINVINNGLSTTGEGILINGALAIQINNAVGYDDQGVPTQRRGVSFINADYCKVSGIFSANTQFGVYMEGGTYNTFTGNAFNNDAGDIIIASGTGNLAYSSYNGTDWIA